MGMRDKIHCLLKIHLGVSCIQRVKEISIMMNIDVEFSCTPNKDTL